MLGFQTQHWGGHVGEPKMGVHKSDHLGYWGRKTMSASLAGTTWKNCLKRKEVEIENKSSHIESKGLS